MRVLASRRGRHRLRRLLLVPAGLPIPIAALAWPASADPHGLVSRAHLPVPAWLFAWAAEIVLIVSFIALGSLWSTPWVEPPVPRRLSHLPGWVEPIWLLRRAGLTGRLGQPRPYPPAVGRWPEPFRSTVHERPDRSTRDPQS